MENVDGDLRILRDFLLLILVRTSHREDSSKVLYDIFTLGLLRTKELGHFLILRKLISSNTKHFLYITRIENLTMRNLHHALNLAVKRKGKSIVTHHTNWGETNISRETILMEIREE